MKKKQNWRKKLVIALRSNWITVVGSIILAGSWWGNKRYEANGQSRIDALRAIQAESVRSATQLLNSTNNTDIFQFFQHQDSIMPLYMITDKLAQEARDGSNYVKISEMCLHPFDYELNYQLEKLYYDTLNIIQSFQLKRDEAELVKLITPKRVFMYEIGLNSMNELNKAYNAESSKLKVIQYIVFVLNIIGILMVTLGKTSKEVFGKDEEAEMLLLLKQIKNQNNNLLNKR